MRLPPNHFLNPQFGRYAGFCFISKDEVVSDRAKHIMQNDPLLLVSEKSRFNKWENKLAPKTLLRLFYLICILNIDTNSYAYPKINKKCLQKARYIFNFSWNDVHFNVLRIKVFWLVKNEIGMLFRAML